MMSGSVQLHTGAEALRLGWLALLSGRGDRCVSLLSGVIDQFVHPYDEGGGDGCAKPCALPPAKRQRGPASTPLHPHFSSVQELLEQVASQGPSIVTEREKHKPYTDGGGSGATFWREVARPALELMVVALFWQRADGSSGCCPTPPRLLTPQHAEQFARCVDGASDAHSAPGAWGSRAIPHFVVAATYVVRCFSRVQRVGCI
jgi:hypothetical protein